MMNINFCLLHATQRVGNDRPDCLKTIDTKSSSLKLMVANSAVQQSLAAFFSLLQLPIASVLVQS